MQDNPNSSQSRLRFSVLDTRTIERIHELALDVLAKQGMVLRFPPAREVLRSHGASVDDTYHIGRIPRRLVEQALKSAPRSFTLYSQSDPTKDYRLGADGDRCARTSTGLNWILDVSATARRPVTQADVVNWTRVAHALPNIHIVSSAYDQEGSAKAMEVRSTAIMLRHSDKPLMVAGVSGEGMRWIQRLTEVIQPVGRQPRVIALSSVNSPLTHGSGQAEVAMVSAELGIPVYCHSSAVAGVAAPVTRAGQLVLMNAEVLAALVIVQLHRPGAPVLYGGHPMVMDMRTGIASHGFTELGVARAACVDIGRYYGLPTGISGLTTDSCTPDAMAATEKWATGYLPAMAGANVNGGAGGLACQTSISLEQMVIDDDIYGRIFPHMRGVEIDETKLAMEAIARVGPGGCFLADDHTLANFRTEYSYSRLANRLNSAAWEAAGSKDVVHRAAETVRAILGARVEPLVSSEQERELRALVARGEVALEGMELPS